MKRIEIPDWLQRHHARMKRVALFLLRNVIIPVVLTLVYVFGIGFTKALLFLKGNPLYRNQANAGSFWVSEVTGAPDEEKYLRQS